MSKKLENLLRIFIFASYVLSKKISSKIKKLFKNTFVSFYSMLRFRRGKCYINSYYFYIIRDYSKQFVLETRE